MILFFEGKTKNTIAVGTTKKLPGKEIEKLIWLFGEAILLDSDKIKGVFVGPRKEMITPWSTNAVEITQNMGIDGISRIEEFHETNSKKPHFDPMLQSLYKGLDQSTLTIDKLPDPVFYIDDIKQYNLKEGLALNEEEIDYLGKLSKTIGRKLTDSEVFGFSQVNSEHCRHKIFNGTFIISGEEKKISLFQMIKATTKTNPNSVVSAYKDNCAFVQGPVVEQFAPATQDKPDFFKISDYESVLSLKAETHNFPTTVEPEQVAR
jgi:phosphoribosylformylglycinamidine synthase